MADEEKQGISKYLDEIGLGILAGLIKGLIYDEQGRNRFSVLAELIGQNTNAINKRALKATESDATDANSYVKKADNADTVDGKHASDFATSAQGTKADSAVQTIQINGTAQTKTNGVVNLPAYPVITGKEDTSNKVSAWSSTTNNIHYPSEKLVKDSLDNKVDKVSGKGLSTNDFTKTLKDKLDGIASGAEVNVQADWNETTTTSDAYIKNKPSIPTVNNGTLTIKAGGTSKGTFTANQSGNTEVNITASDLGLSSALRYIEDLSALPTPTTSDKYQNGDVVTVGDKEYMRTGKTSSSAGSWKELGAESSHALKTITITGTGALSGGGSLEQNRTITHNNSGVTAGTYKSVTVDAKGHVTAGTNPTTLSGYGITDAKIANGVVTLGNNSITPITSHQDVSGKENSSNKVSSWRSTTDNVHYPSEKLVKDSLDGKQNLITTTNKLSYSLVKDTPTSIEHANVADYAGGLIKFDCDDSARAILGGDWRMPTHTEQDELINNTTTEWVTNYKGSGINGRLLTSKQNGNTIFLPSTGGARYYSSSLTSSDKKKSWYLSFNDSVIGSYSTFQRYSGGSIRPVSQSVGVDLGLPSGLKWASCNLTATGLANKETDPGDFFAWGETKPKSTYTWATYKYSNADGSVMTKYNSEDGKTVLDLNGEITTASISEFVTKKELTSTTAIANSHVALADKVNITTIRLTDVDNLDDCKPSALPTKWNDSFYNVYEWHSSSIPANCPCKGISWMEVSAIPDITSGQYRWNIIQKLYRSNGADDYFYIYTRTGWWSTSLYWSNWMIMNDDYSCTRLTASDDLNTLYNGTLLTSTSQNRVERYDWASSRPSNSPEGTTLNGELTQTIRYETDSSTYIEQHIVGRDMTVIPRTHKEYSRHGVVANGTITWTDWVELTQESRALTEEEITNIWNNVFN